MMRLRERLMKRKYFNPLPTSPFAGGGVITAQASHPTTQAHRNSLPCQGEGWGGVAPHHQTQPLEASYE
jgi:hypothetical protein